MEMRINSAMKRINRINRGTNNNAECSVINTNVTPSHSDEVKLIIDFFLVKCKIEKEMPLAVVRLSVQMMKSSWNHSNSEHLRYNQYRAPKIL